MTYKETLENTIDAYEKGLPDKFVENVIPRDQILDKETSRSNYLMNILQNALLLVEEPDNIEARNELLNGVVDTLRHFSESGGAGSETLSRLMGLGIIEEFPKVIITDNMNYVSRKESKVTVDKDKGIIVIDVQFNANTPDEEGNETHALSNFDGYVCKAQLQLNCQNTDQLRTYLEKLQKDYSTLMKMKYPDWYNED